ncbi:MAG: hypothetical protein NTY09_14975 [bacterium]|nr:hypothetical protein [bacterium]
MQREPLLVGGDVRLVKYSRPNPIVLNAYRYSSNSPVILSDSDGLLSPRCDEVWETAKANYLAKIAVCEKVYDEERALLASCSQELSKAEDASTLKLINAIKKCLLIFGFGAGISFLVGLFVPGFHIITAVAAIALATCIAVALEQRAEDMFWINSCRLSLVCKFFDFYIAYQNCLIDAANGMCRELIASGCFIECEEAEETMKNPPGTDPELIIEQAYDAQLCCHSDREFHEGLECFGFSSCPCSGLF